jgi:hypothetical protein
MFELYYLVDQNGDINGNKTLTASFDDEASAHAKASADGVLHYSIERINSEESETIVFVC